MTNIRSNLEKYLERRKQFAKDLRSKTGHTREKSPLSKAMAEKKVSAETLIDSLRSEVRVLENSKKTLDLNRKMKESDTKLELAKKSVDLTNKLSLSRSKHAEILKKTEETKQQIALMLRDVVSADQDENPELKRLREKRDSLAETVKMVETCVGRMSNSAFVSGACEKLQLLATELVDLRKKSEEKSNDVAALRMLLPGIETALKEKEEASASLSASLKRKRSEYDSVVREKRKRISELQSMISDGSH